MVFINVVSNKKKIKIQLEVINKKTKHGIYQKTQQMAVILPLKIKNRKNNTQILVMLIQD